MFGKDDKNDKINYRKELEQRRNELTVLMKGSEIGSDDYNKYKGAIHDIDEILKDADDSNQKKKQTLWTAVKVLGGIGLGVAGLAWSHKDDISDSVPGKFMHSFVDKILHRNM